MQQKKQFVIEQQNMATENTKSALMETVMFRNMTGN